jgi:glucosamine kinase
MSANSQSISATTHAPCFFGLDVGGTQSRWALAAADGALLAEGMEAGFSGVNLASNEQRAVVQQRLNLIADAVLRWRRIHQLRGVYAGVTGIGDAIPALRVMLAAAFALAESDVHVTSDAELAFYAVLAPDEGYLVYAGTGSIAAFVDASGQLHRAGGRGVVLDDAGGGYWIAREALRRIWRREDEGPGAWHASPMAAALFATVGGDSSIYSARYLMEKSRGDVGMLAVIVAAHADDDALAAEIMNDAGVELARLANAMLRRHGERKIVVTGRASRLHPLIELAMRRAMGTDAIIEFRQVQAHIAAAHLAAQRYVVNKL